VRSLEVRAFQVRVPEVRAFQVSFPEERAPQVRSVEVRASQVTPHQIKLVSLQLSGEVDSRCQISQTYRASLARPTRDICR